MKKILIGGKALNILGSKRHTEDTDYLICDENSKDAFITSPDTDYLNANGNKFFKEIYEKEKENQIATPQSLLELKAYAFVQHCQNFNFQKADDCEYDMKFLVRKFNLTAPKIVRNCVGSGEYKEIVKVVDSVRI